MAAVRAATVGRLVANIMRSAGFVYRWSGRLYLLIGVLVGGVAGLAMAFHAFGRLVSQLGFGCLAVAWRYTGVLAYLAIR